MHVTLSCKYRLVHNLSRTVRAHVECNLFSTLQHTVRIPVYMKDPIFPEVRVLVPVTDPQNKIKKNKVTPLKA